MRKIDDSILNKPPRNLRGLQVLDALAAFREIKLLVDYIHKGFLLRRIT